MSGRELRERTPLYHTIPEWMEEESGDCILERNRSARNEDYAPPPQPNPLKRNREDEDDVISERIRLPGSLIKPFSDSISQPLGKRSKAISPPDGWTPLEIDKWTCGSCGFIQRNQRRYDLKRHERKHAIDSEPFICCGIRESDIEAESFVQAIPRGKRAERIFVHGAWRTGGCQETFTRLDALKRHLKSKHGLKCTTDYNEYYSGNGKLFA